MPPLELNRIQTAFGDNTLVQEIDAAHVEGYTTPHQPARHLLAAELQQIRDLVGEDNLEWMAKDILEGGTYIDAQCDWIAIRHDVIDDVLHEDLSNDTYMIGNFRAGCIAEATGWPEFLVDLAQASDQQQELGDAMTSEQVSELVRIYVAADGYGHHFARHDGNEHEIRMNTTVGTFYFFRVE